MVALALTSQKMEWKVVEAKPMVVVIEVDLQQGVDTKEESLRDAVQGQEPAVL
jgi:hypothetical protein